MRAVVTRVGEARVEVAGEVISEIAGGLLVLLGVAATDTAADGAYLAKKILDLRIFRDENGAMNRSLDEAGGAILVVSQFTLFGDVRKGRRPSFISAAPAELGRERYEAVVDELRRLGAEVRTGRFAADMRVFSVNDGPVTLLLDSTKAF